MLEFKSKKSSLEHLLKILFDLLDKIRTSRTNHLFILGYTTVGSDRLYYQFRYMINLDVAFNVCALCFTTNNRHSKSKTHIFSIGECVQCP